jgi:hypothetical protein
VPHNPEVAGSNPAAVLTDILLYDGDHGAAWDIATEHGASDRNAASVRRYTTTARDMS